MTWLLAWSPFVQPRVSTGSAVGPKREVGNTCNHRFDKSLNFLLRHELDTCRWRVIARGIRVAASSCKWARAYLEPRSCSYSSTYRTCSPFVLQCEGNTCDYAGPMCQGSSFEVGSHLSGGYNGNWVVHVCFLSDILSISCYLC